MDIGSFTIRKKTKPPDFTIPDDIDEKYEKAQASGKKLILGTLVARSGTRWLCDIFSAHDNATGVTERYVDAEAFFRYVTFHNLPIDLAGIVKLIKKGIVEDWENADVSLVFSPYFSHGMELLINELKPKETVIGIADPKFTVQSIYNKGLFKEEYWYENHDKVVGYQPHVGLKMSHFFGRVVPSGSEYLEWKELTQVGKISWWGNRIMSDIYKQMNELQNHHFYIFDLKQADQNYEYYLNLNRHFGLEPVLSKNTFISLKGKTVKKSDNAVHSWTKVEIKEFQNYSKDWNNIYSQLKNNF